MQGINCDKEAELNSQTDYLSGKGGLIQSKQFVNLPAF